MWKKLQIKKHALTGISFMLPLVVASGLLIAIGNCAIPTKMDTEKLQKTE